jgi:hypothetical protein
LLKAIPDEVEEEVSVVVEGERRADEVVVEKGVREGIETFGYLELGTILPVEPTPPPA